MFAVVSAYLGLGVSAFLLASGIAFAGVQTGTYVADQFSAAQQTAEAYQAAAMFAHTPGIASSTPPRDNEASSTVMYCPKLVKTILRGNRDASSTQDVSELQHFIVSKYGLDASSTITGYFGSTTQGYLERFQREEGIAPAPSVGPLTRAAIARLCGMGINAHMGSSTPMDNNPKGEGQGFHTGSSTPAVNNNGPKDFHPLPVTGVSSTSVVVPSRPPLSPFGDRPATSSTTQSGGAPCTTPWGNVTVASGSVLKYQPYFSKGVFSDSMVSPRMLCSNGVWSQASSSPHGF